MDRYIARRVSLENLGDSAFDDGIIKNLLQEYIMHLNGLLQEIDPVMVRYKQGYLACLESVILKLRQHNAKELANQEEQ